MYSQSTGPGQPHSSKTLSTQNNGNLCSVGTPHIMCPHCLRWFEMFVLAGIASSSLLEVADPTRLALWNMHPLFLLKCSASVFHCSQGRTPATRTHNREFVGNVYIYICWTLNGHVARDMTSTFTVSIGMLILNSLWQCIRWCWQCLHTTTHLPPQPTSSTTRNCKAD